MMRKKQKWTWLNLAKTVQMFNGFLRVQVSLHGQVNTLVMGIHFLCVQSQIAQSTFCFADIIVQSKVRYIEKGKNTNVNKHLIITFS